MKHGPFTSLPLAFTLLAFAAAGAFALEGGPPPNRPGGQGGGQGGGPAGGPGPGGGLMRGPDDGDAGRKAPEQPKDDGDSAEQVDVKGNGYRVTLKNGSVIVGVLPRGKIWERPDDLGSFEETKETEKGAGIRLYYVLGLDGEIFIAREDIASDDKNVLMLRDLGELTEKQKADIRARVLNDRRKVIEDRAKKNKEELERIGEAEAEALKGGGLDGEKAETRKKEATEDEKKGDALLEKFPSPEWSEQRVRDIISREVVNGIFRNDQEREFIDGFKLWQAALERKVKAEAEKEKGGQ